MLYPGSLSLSRRLWLSSMLLHAVWHAVWMLGCNDSNRAAIEPPAEPAAAPAPATPPNTPEDTRPPATTAAHAEAPRAPAKSGMDPGTLELAAFHAGEAPGRRLPDQHQDDSEDTAPGKYGPRKGRFQLTYYWMADEKRRKSRRKVRLYNKDCKPIAKVSSTFAARLELEGTGMLSDGRVVNVAGTCKCDKSPCFFVVNEDHKRWGVGVGDRPLSPFRSVAVDPSLVSIGANLYIPELDGLVMPGAPPWGGFVHDGCVIADDRGGGVAGKQLDFFMVRRPYYDAFHRRHRLTQVTVHAGGDRCARERKNVLPADRNSI